MYWLSNSIKFSVKGTEFRRLYAVLVFSTEAHNIIFFL